MTPRRKLLAPILAVVAFAAVVAACDPAPSVPAPPPDQPPVATPAPGPAITVYGDSLVGESETHLRERLEAQFPTWTVVIHALGGTAQCDFHQAMRDDVAAYDVQAAVIAFTGNNLTSCITSRPFVAGYRADANWAVDFWVDEHGVPLVFTAAPGPVGTAPSQRQIAAVYYEVGSARGVYVADATPLFANAALGLYAQAMPCLVGECTTTIGVRAPDGAHLCPIAGLRTACPVYSSGVVRYVDSLVRSAAYVTGTPIPPPRTMVSLPSLP